MIFFPALHTMPPRLMLRSVFLEPKLCPGNLLSYSSYVKYEHFADPPATRAHPSASDTGSTALVHLSTEIVQIIDLSLLLTWGGPFEFHNHSLLDRQLGFLRLFHIPPCISQWVLLTLLQRYSKRFSKATVELISTPPTMFHNLLVTMDLTLVSLFIHPSADPVELTSPPTSSFNYEGTSGDSSDHNDDNDAFSGAGIDSGAMGADLSSSPPLSRLETPPSWQCY
ncbi:hypothetical protein F511_18727 [Dorcoceras hygrometricum]|uniref:Uncharacterized protein n=1 Tax=Dorcoceras hygrometricum TaxID=472368 RepID=A0A2Z7AE84_9LAMI|nr:hypothetical protein F511_18727 [Dorcoceras hygrometricum]